MTPASRRRGPWLLAVAAGLLLTATAIHAAPVALPDDVLTSHWYTISILGNRSGWSEQAMRRTATGYETLERTMLRVALDGRTLTSARTETRQYDADLRMVSIDNDADQIGRKVHVSARREGDKLVVTRTDPDGEKRQELPAGEHFGEDLQVLRAVLDQQITPTWQFTFRTYDCDLGQIDEITLSAVERITDPEPAWVLQAHSKLLNVASKTWVNDKGVILRQEVPGMMQMAMRLVSEQEALADLEPFLLASSVPVDQELGRPERLQRVRLEVTDAGADANALFATTPRQTVTPGERNAVVEVRAGSVPVHPGQLPFSGPELQPYLTPSETAPSGDPRLVAQAKAIIGGERDAWKAACLLTRWVHREVAKVSSEPRPLSALEVLQIKRGDCTEHTVLLAALAQAVGIPARMAAGLAYDARAYHYHAWNELYVGEWVEMDPTWGEETVDAGHIQITASALDSTSVARLSLAASKTMGGLKLKVLDYAARP